MDKFIDLLLDYVSTYLKPYNIKLTPAKQLWVKGPSLLCLCVRVSQEPRASSVLTYNAALIKNVLAMLLLIVCSPRAHSWHQNILLRAIHLTLNQPVSKRYLQLWHQQPQQCVLNLLASG